jgi:hypothetical protein
MLFIDLSLLESIYKFLLVTSLFKLLLTDIVSEIRVAFSTLTGVLHFQDFFKSSLRCASISACH